MKGRVGFDRGEGGPAPALHAGEGGQAQGRGAPELVLVAPGEGRQQWAGSSGRRIRTLGPGQSNV